MALEARKLRFEPSIDLLPPDDSVSVSENRRRETFGPDLRFVVALQKAHREGGVLEQGPREALVDLQRGLEGLPGIRRVSSLVNAPTLVSSPGSSAGAPVWSGTGPGSREALIANLSTSDVERYTFLSPLWSLTPLYLDTDPQVPEAELLESIRRLGREVERSHPGGGDVLVVGPGVVETSLAGTIFDDLQRLIPFALIVVVTVLLLALRDLRLFLVATLHSLALLAIVLGGMAAAGLSVNLISVLAPVILIPFGVSDLLYLFVRLRSGVDSELGNSAGPLLRRAFSRLDGAMLGSSATTALGFLGFLISPVPAIRQFGLTMSVGVSLALFLTFTFDAALLSLVWRPPTSTPLRESRALSRLERTLIALRSSQRTLRLSSRAALTISALLVLAGAVSLTRLEISDTWIQNFDQGSRIAADTRTFESELMGTNLLAVVVKPETATPEARLRAAGAVNAMTTEMGFMPGVKTALSATLLARALDPHQGKPWTPWPTPPLDRLSAAMATWDASGALLPRSAMLADPGLDQFQVLLFVLNQPYADLVRVMEAIRTRSEELAGSGASVSIGGNLAANIRMVRLAVLGHGYSLVSLLIIMSVLAVLFTRSVRAGMILILPLSVAILATYGLLIAAGIPYGVAVSMFATLVIGSAIDFAIYLRTELVRSRSEPARVWAHNLSLIVYGVLLNGGLWVCGFAVLTVSGLPPNRYLGLLCCVVYALSTAATLLLLPTAALIVDRTFVLRRHE